MTAPARWSRCFGRDRCAALEELARSSPTPAWRSPTTSLRAQNAAAEFRGWRRTGGRLPADRGRRGRPTTTSPTPRKRRWEGQGRPGGKKRRHLKAVEIAGTTGYSEETLLEKWARDSKILDIFEGTQQVQQLVVARRLLGLSSSELK
jgi:alkylation response protein AidB-like acyl-CoA dehydrogenase